MLIFYAGIRKKIKTKDDITTMCLAIPGKIVKIEGEHAMIDYGGASREANISLVDVNVGDYVIVHAGFAIQKLNEKEAKETLKAWKEILRS